MPMIAAGSLRGFAPLRSCGDVQYCSGSSSRLRTFFGGEEPGFSPPPVFFVRFVVVFIGGEKGERFAWGPRESEGEGSVGAREEAWISRGGKREVEVEKRSKRC